MKKSIIAIFLLIWMGVVFWFSAENALESKDTSGFVMQKILSVLNIEIEDTEMLEGYLRTLAHFVLYLLGGFIACILVIVCNIKHKILSTSMFGLLYAIGDEIHQIYVPGRSFELKDIVVDISGFLLGVLVVYALYWVGKRIKGILR